MKGINRTLVRIAFAAIIIFCLLASALVFPLSSARSSGNSIVSSSAGNPYPHDHQGTVLLAKSDKATNPHATVSVPVTVSAQSTADSGEITISSSPAGAQVFVDGSYRGITPISIRGVSTGEHPFRLVLAGYTEFSGGVTVSSGKISDSVVTLTPATVNGASGPAFRWDDPVVLLTVLGIVTTVVGAVVTVASMIPWKKKESEKQP